MKIYDKTIEITDELKFEMGCTFEEAEPALKDFEIDREHGETLFADKENMMIGPFLCKIQLHFFRDTLRDITITPDHFVYIKEQPKTVEEYDELLNRCAQDIVSYVEQSLVGFEKIKCDYFSTSFSNKDIRVGISTDLYYDFTIGIHPVHKQ